MERALFLIFSIIQDFISLNFSSICRKSIRRQLLIKNELKIAQLSGRCMLGPQKVSVKILISDKRIKGKKDFKGQSDILF